MQRKRHLLATLCSLAFAACHGGGEAATSSNREAAGITVGTEHVRFTVPEGWERTTPSSRMRIAQATIPGTDGPAELAVFYFGEGQGGGVHANIARWIDQIELTPGTAPRREQIESGELTITVVDVGGTLKPGRMGMGPSSAQPGSRLLGAVVEGPGGPWFFKVTGPDTTVAAQRENFLGLLRTVRTK